MEPRTTSPASLRTILNEWQGGPSSTHPAPFPGPFAPRAELVTWLDQVKGYCETELKLHHLQWANAIISWLPQSGGREGATVFRGKILERIQVKRKKGQLTDERFWEWGEFEREFLKMCEEQVQKRARSKSLSTENEVTPNSLLVVRTATRIGGSCVTIVGGFMVLGAILTRAEAAGLGPVGPSSLVRTIQSTPHRGAFPMIKFLMAWTGTTPASTRVIIGIALIIAGTLFLVLAENFLNGNKTEGERDFIGDIGDVAFD